MRIALLSNVTADVLAGMLGREHAVWCAPGFGAWMEIALEPPADLIAFAPDAICILLDRRFEGARPWSAADVTAARVALARTFPRIPVIMPDVAALAADFGADFYEPKMWSLASMPFSLKGLHELKRLFAPKKVLALDLDNTLWRGVIGEDGADGIVPDTDFQRRVLAVRARGIVLVALSKNNAADVEAVWRDPRMALKRDDFVACAIDWTDKSANLVRIAAELNLGLESFVFVDDNPAERMQMRARCPEVCTAAFPADLDVYFPAVIVTDEDRNKTAQYRAEAKRREWAVGLSLEDYLNGLEIRTDIHPITEGECVRVAQLSQKSNQFNACTNRYSAADVIRFAVDPAHLTLTLHAADRFGDLGLVAFVHAAPVGGAGSETTYGIVDWVMSCRAMNRRLEFALQRELEEELKRRGVTCLTAAWRRTARNEPVRELFERFGFTPRMVTEEEKRYERILVQGR